MFWLVAKIKLVVGQNKGWEMRTEIKVLCLCFCLLSSFYYFFCFCKGFVLMLLLQHWVEGCYKRAARDEKVCCATKLCTLYVVLHLVKTFAGLCGRFCCWARKFSSSSTYHIVLLLLVKHLQKCGSCVVGFVAEHAWSPITCLYGLSGIPKSPAWSSW